MQGKAQDDDLVMVLVDLTLAVPAEDREDYLQKKCGGDQELFRLVWQREGWPIGAMTFDDWQRLVDLVHAEAGQHDFPGPIRARRVKGVLQISACGLA